MRTVLAVAFAVTFAGCSTTFIANTTVEDSSANRRVLDFCEDYRRAMESRNRGALLAMASTDYYEDGGTPTASDDYDYSGLREVLADRFEHVKAVRYDIRYREVSAEGEAIHVDYTYSASFQLETPLGDRWYRKIEDNRLVLVPMPNNRGFRIVSGM